MQSKRYIHILHNIAIYNTASLHTILLPMYTLLLIYVCTFYLYQDLFVTEIQPEL